MPFFFKPVVWNSEGYRKPSGARSTSGYPFEHGFGHEEWNNSDRFTYSVGKDRFKVFHSEGLGNQDIEEIAGLTAMMLIASHAGSQWLVGIAAGCTPLLGKNQKETRLQLARTLKLDSHEMAEEAWAIEAVQQKHASKAAFLRVWQRDFHWIPNWTCPADLYLALHDPVRLDPASLTGRNRLVNMYGSYQPTDRAVFLRVLGAIPAGVDDAAVRRLADWAGGEVDVASDVSAISSASPTMRAALIQARIGQGAFREQVMAAWNDRCAVTGCAVHEMLRASHIQPWRSCTNEQRLDPENGMMLAAHLDALFDRGLISFSDAGEMLISSLVPKDSKIWGVGERLQHAPSRRQATYLDHHRTNVFRQ